jgi:F0F1-type ATP synthase epsilon subunit
MNGKVDKTLQLIVASPDGEILNVSGVKWVNLKLSDGYPISIYPDHAPLIALTAACNLKYRVNEQIFEKQISKGVLSIANNIVKCWVSLGKTTLESNESSREKEE